MKVLYGKFTWGIIKYLMPYWLRSEPRSWGPKLLTVHYNYLSSLENIISCVWLAEVWAKKLWGLRLSTVHYIYLSSLDNMISSVWLAEVWAKKIWGMRLSTVHYPYLSSLENIISCVWLAEVWAEKLRTEAINSPLYLPVKFGQYDI